MMKMKTKMKVDCSIHPCAGKSAAEMTAILNNRYTSVTELKDAFIVSSEQGPILITWDSAHNDWVGQPFQNTGGVHFLDENGNY